MGPELETLWSLLEKEKAIIILLSLREEPKHIRQLHRAVGGSLSTLEARLKDFLVYGFVVASEEPAWPHRRVFKLTSRGAAIAEGLVQIPTPKKRPVPRPGFSLGSRDRWILVLLHLLREIKGSTRLVKLLFLLKRELRVPTGPFYKFEYHRFGPYDKEILGDIRRLEDAGLVKVEEKKIEGELEDEAILRIYNLTESGHNLAQKIAASLPMETRLTLEVLKEFNSWALPELLAYVYHKFPKELKENQTKLDSFYYLY